MHDVLRQLRLRLLARAGLRALAAAFLIGTLGKLLGLEPATATTLGLVAGVLALAAQYRAGRRRWPTLDSLAEHLNRRFPVLEESAQLLLAGSPEIGPVKDIQRRRVAAAWELCIQRRTVWLPPLSAGLPIAIIGTALAAMVLAKPLNEWWNQRVSDTSFVAGQEGSLPAPALTSLLVRAIPPGYTGMPEALIETPDIEVVQGSRVEWTLGFNRAGRYELELSDGEKIDLVLGEDGLHRASAVIESNQLYRISLLQQNGVTQLINVHSIAVMLDRAPKIQIIDPAPTLLEIPASAPARFESEVLVSDDFGVDRAEIRASVAKGSGEGVKFRDEVLSFDSSILSDDGVIYHHVWSLVELGMEPGDELYFFVNAFDNRQPRANRGRSETIVVRWLEEGETMASAQGIAIDLMPEYFKSQRQIIIETVELIADRAHLNPDRFDTLARGLGQDQGSLKLRYGQYLGDEAEGFGRATAIDDEASTESPEEHEDHDPGHESGGHEDHDHGSGFTGSAEALIEQFTHDHEAADVGPITSRNPVGLMKRALSNMWQAELHLLLSDPEQALPFENEALKYLNLARQADRIYTERLGFEPPPVTEDRRLSGDLDEITSYARADQGVDADSDDALFSSAFERMHADDDLDDEALSELRLAGERLTRMAQNRPGLLEQAARLERWIASTDHRKACGECREDLARLFWSLVKQPDPPPEPGSRILSATDPMIREYGETRVRTGPIPEAALQ
jgi:hypothetical protein